MEIRFATEKDTIHAIRSLQKNQTFFNTTTHLKDDIARNRLIVVEENGKLLGSCALVPEVSYGYTAIKRLIVYSKKQRGRGIADKIIKYIISLNLGTIGATPWESNKIGRHLFEKNDFEFQYKFLENYCFYKRG